MKITRDRDTSKVLAQAKEALFLELTRLSQEHTSVLLLVSGGSALQLLNHFEFSSCLGPWVSVGVLDERYSRDPNVNNFCQLMKTDFYMQAVSSGCKFIDSRIDSTETMEECTARLDFVLKNWVKENKGGQIIITLGVGSDGHTAGIMPMHKNPREFDKLFLSPEVWVVGYDAGDKNIYPLRITTTLSFLEKVNFAVAFVNGEGKRVALESTLAEKGELWSTPARIIHKMKGAVVFTDIV